MQHENTTPQVIELTEEIPGGVQFDAEAASLLGVYRDELSLYRAKRAWTQILETNFLLEPAYDYVLSPAKDPEAQKFVLQCQFLTACGRYTFWRLTNDQAPEAQYLIETAHIPFAEMRGEDLMQAPDLQPIRYSSDYLETASNSKRNTSKDSPLSVKTILNSLWSMLFKKK